MSTIKGWTLITDAEERGILVLGKRGKDLILLNLKSLSVSEVALYWKEPENSREILEFFTNSFNGFKKFLIDLLEVRFDVVKVEINTETNELFFI